VTAVYVDTSWVVAIAFAEPGHDRLASQLASFDTLLSSNLLEAELRAVLAREGVPEGLENLVSPLRWIVPGRPLSAEIERVARAGYVRGADLWHLACALLVDPQASELAFATLDEAQGKVAATLGFRVP